VFIVAGHSYHIYRNNAQNTSAVNCRLFRGGGATRCKDAQYARRPKRP
jgi:hypothetical protein